MNHEEQSLLRKTGRKVIGAVLTIMICLFVDIGTGPFASDLQNQFQQSRHGIVHVGAKEKEPQKSSVENVKWLGTGFLVHQNCTFVTAKHVIRNVNKNNLIVRFQLPGDITKVRTIPVRLLFEDATRDIAFLKIDQFDGQPCKSGTLHTFPIFSGDLKVLTGDEIIIIGYPVIAKKDLDIPIVRTGIISSVEIKWGSHQMLLVDLVGVPGFSGSPIIRVETGEVVGVVYGPGPTKRAFGFEWGTPIRPGDLRDASSNDTQDIHHESQ